MKIAIYGEQPEAIEYAKRLRAEKHSAFIRNAQFFDPENFDKAFDLVLSDDPVVTEAFKALGVETKALLATIGQKEIKPAPAPMPDLEPEPIEDEPKAKPGRPKKK